MKLQKHKNKVLALDQALQQSGWALFGDENELLDYGIIRPNKEDKGDFRFVTVRDKWAELIERFKPDVICLEIPYGDDLDNNKGRKTFSVLNGTFWMCKELAARYHIKIQEISAATWQNRCSIFKRDRISRKIGAKQFAIKQFHLSDELEQDIYDACCIGWTYFYQQEFREISAF